MALLTQIKFTLPSQDKSFTEQFTTYLSSQGERNRSGITLNISQEEYFPKTSFQFTDKPYVLFCFEDGDEVEVAINNVTDVTKKSPYPYSHITLETFIDRMKQFPLMGIDHTGFNLPYFDGIHPQILTLREKLKDACLYHTFPKHIEDAPWDFIIPGTREEIERSVEVDYHQTRKPKFEIVSFDSASTPLIQIDIQVKGHFEDFAKAFPEAIHIPEIKNVWVYIKNDFGIDVCFVVNENADKDWSYEFRNERL